MSRLYKMAVLATTCFSFAGNAAIANEGKIVSAFGSFKDTWTYSAIVSDQPFSYSIEAQHNDPSGRTWCNVYIIETSPDTGNDSTYFYFDVNVYVKSLGIMRSAVPVEISETVVALPLSSGLDSSGGCSSPYPNSSAPLCKSEELRVQAKSANHADQLRGSLQSFMEACSDI